jgi:hypothetical protein
MNRWFTFFVGAAAAVAFLVTCGGVPGANGATGDGIYKSGTRIKVKVLRSGDGAQVFAGLFDSQRQEDCVVRETTTGMRCLPIGIATLSTIYFTDETCSSSVPAVGIGSTAPKYWIDWSAAGVVTAIGTAGAKLDSAFGGTPCSAGPPYGVDVYARGSPISLESFVAFDSKTLD